MQKLSEQSAQTRAEPTAVAHFGEPLANEMRQRLAAIEPRSLRTFTPNQAVFEKSEGSYHFTPDGRKLADFTSGVLVANLGHNPIRWWQRLLRHMKLDRMPPEGSFFTAVPLTTYNAATDLELYASERLVARLRAEPGGDRLEQVLWAASGSEAVHKALTVAMARRPGADRILATRGGFHGKKGLAGAVTGSEQDPQRDPRVRFISFPCQECDSLARSRQPIDLSPYEAELEELTGEIGDQLCCVITEPYLGGGGSFHPQHDYLQLLQTFCRQHDLLLILDEVQSNFGRTGPMFAFTKYGLEPDMVILGKGMGNGIPVDAVVGKSELFAALTYGEASDTWSGHPLGCAAVLATLEEFEEGDVLEQGAALAEVLEQGLTRLGELDAVAAVRGEGTVWGIECAPVGQRSAPDVARDVIRACYVGDEQGRAIHLLGPLAGKVIRVAPPLVMPLDEAREYLTAMYNIIAAGNLDSV